MTTTNNTSNPGETTPAGPELRAALLGIDMQPTFCEGGELPVAGGNAVCEAAAEFVATHRGRYALTVLTQDWHVDPGDHFAADPDFVDSWPAHGVAGTSNADLHPALAATHADVRIRKGAHEAAYSGFDGTDADGSTLLQALRAAGVTHVDVIGIAESHCVRATVLDALRYGFTARVLADLTVPVTPDLGTATRVELAAAGATYTSSVDAFPTAEPSDADLPGTGGGPS